MGVRMALGAGQAEIVRMVVRQGVLLAIVGVGFGLGGAFALTRLLRTLLFGIDVKDPLTFVVAPLG
jgi:ABC-type antimicrobial peptide transport system permease subunit